MLLLIRSRRYLARRIAVPFAVWITSPIRSPDCAALLSRAKSFTETKCCSVAGVKVIPVCGSTEHERIVSESKGQKRSQQRRKRKRRSEGKAELTRGLRFLR